MKEIRIRTEIGEEVEQMIGIEEGIFTKTTDTPEIGAENGVSIEIVVDD